MNSRGLIQFFHPVRRYSAKAGTQITAVSKKKLDLATTTDESAPLEVEKDTQRLVSYVCGTNLLAEGGEDIKIKPDSEYPEWLWKTGKPLPLEQLDRNSPEFWRRVRNMRVKEEKYLKSLMRNSTVHK